MKSMHQVLFNFLDPVTLQLSTAEIYIQYLIFSVDNEEGSL